jgi:hypothetical protein
MWSTMAQPMIPLESSSYRIALIMTDGNPAAPNPSFPRKRKPSHTKHVIPAQAGTQEQQERLCTWVLAYAGMT